MNDEQFQKMLRWLEDHEKRIQTLENIAPKIPFKKEPIEGKKKLSKSKGEDLLPPIQKLFQDGFFKEWRTDLEVCENLRIKLLTKKKPLRASVVNVLRAMVKKGLLMRDKVQRNKRQVFAYKQP